MRSRKSQFEVPQELEGEYELTVLVPSSKLALILKDLKEHGITDGAIEHIDRTRQPHPGLQTVTQAEYSNRSSDGRIWKNLCNIVAQNPDLPVQQVDDQEGQRIVGDLPAVIGWAQTAGNTFSTSIMYLTSILSERVVTLIPGDRTNDQD